jgi:RNA polymerase sigma factor (sigma-70 family)
MEHRGGPSDAELVRRALGATTTADRKAAFAAIADRYHLTVFRQCARWFPHPEEAQDVGQAAFEAAFTLLAAGKAPERPEKLAGWLVEIARRRGQEYRRKDISAGVSWAILPEGQSLDEIEDDTEPRSGSAIRRARATRLVETVVATLTARQQEIYQLRITSELTGAQVAERLGITSKAASNEITRVQDLIAAGFGALILFQEGRRYCPDLARIIETAPDAVGTAAFTTALRERIVHHFDNCRVCDDCHTCNAKRRELVGPYVPAVVPILFAADLRDRITEIIDRITGQARHPSPRRPESGTPATATAAVAIAAAHPPRPGTVPVTPVRRMARRGRRALSAGHGTGAAVLLVAVAALVTGIVLASGASAPAGAAGGYSRSVTADQPIAYWQFNDAIGASEYVDSSGHGNNLPAGPTTLTSHVGPGSAGAISLAQGGTSTRAPLSPLVGDAARTAEAWFKTTSGGCVLVAGADGHTGAFSLCLMDGPVNSPTPGAPGFYLQTWDADIFIPIPNMTDDRWHYLALTLSGTTVHIVIDGTQPPGYVWNGTGYGGLTTQPFTLPYTPDTGSSPLGVGTAGLGGISRGLAGTIAEVAIYPRALPVSELIKHYQLFAGSSNPAR